MGAIKEDRMYDRQQFYWKEVIKRDMNMKTKTTSFSKTPIQG
jgi:hypothetical protein